MRNAARAVAALASAACLASTSFAQTYTNCNPTTQSNCPADSALATTVNIDFTSASDSFTAQGSPTYDSNGVSFTISKQGDSPQLTSKWYIMFGKVEVVAKAAPGTGIVSSVVLQSDDLDEIDWEWLGGDSGNVQTIYFGKGDSSTSGREATIADSGSQSGFKTYTLLWSSSQIVWQINGVTVRTLEPANANGQYPQTPMRVKMGAWAGGDPSNAAGTIAWAGGQTDYTKGPFTMQVKSVMVQDYSTGTSYSYGDTSGTWSSIKSNGGKINSGGTPVESNSPTITSTSNGQPIPFTPKGDTSSFVTPSIYPWVPESTTLATATATYGTYPGLPSGWTVSSSGKVIPPSSAPSTAPLDTSTPSSAPLPQASSGASEVITAYDQQGFTTVYTVAAGASSQPKSYDVSGFLITSAPALPTPTSAPTAASPSSGTNVLENNKVKTSTVPPVPSASSSAYRLLVDSSLISLAAFIGGAFIL